MKVLMLLLALTIMVVGCKDEEGSGGSGEESGAKKECTVPYGGLLPHGAVVTAFRLKVVQDPAKCESEVRTCNDGVLSGSFTHKECAVETSVDVEPATHERPMRINDKDLKVGGVKEMGKLSTYSSGKYEEMFPPKPKLEDIVQCAPGTQRGSPCVEGSSICKIENMVFSCNTQTTYKVFGWVYEEIGRDYKPAEGVTADIFWFAGCFVGFCSPMAGPVKTDKFGYFEILTTGLLDSVRLNGFDVGLYAFCKDGKPIAGGGSYISSEMVGKPFSDAFSNQKRLKPDSCKL